MQDIVPFDWPRMLLGEAPPLFLLEILFRVAVIWVWTAALLRWIGGRSISQLSIVEFLLVIALGSAVGDALFYPEVPLLHAMLVILAIVCLDKAMDIAIRRWSRAKTLIDGNPVQVVDDGRILHDRIGARQIGALELMEMLRMKGVENLGTLRAAWLEPSGGLSVFRADRPRPGLPIVPPVENADLPPPGDSACCVVCGSVQDRPSAECPDCGGTRWTVPVLAAG